MSACPDCPIHGWPDTMKRERCCIQEERAKAAEDAPISEVLRRAYAPGTNRRQRRAAAAKERRAR